jgi:hypothetical protein
MASKALQQALENIYTALNNDNEDIDLHIASLKSAMGANGEKEISVDPNRLPQNNRQGRKMLQSYFKKRGVDVSFSE